MKIFVGNVDERTTQEELSALFEHHGTVVSCAVMKQFAFVHMREEDRALAAIAALNGRELNGRKMVVELSKPRPLNTWKVFVGNVSASCTATELRSLFEAYGRVVECDIVKDYAFVHMEREAEAKDAIEHLNGKDLKGKRINVELSTKVQKKGSGPNGQSDKSRRNNREASQTRSEDFDQRRSLDGIYSQYAMTSPYDQRAYLEASRYDAYENRQRLQSMYYGRDRSPMRRSPPLVTGYSMPTSALAAQYRAQSGAYSSQLASAYGAQASAALASAYGAQASAALAAAYGAQASTYGTSTSSLGSTYGNQAASSLASAYGNQTSAALASAYGDQASSLTVAYGAQAGTGGSAQYSSQAAGLASPYSSQASAALAASYRQAANPLGAYDSASQLAALAQQSAAYSALSQHSPTDTSGYERTRLSPPRASALDAYRKSPELMKRFGSDRRYTESEYRRLAESQVAFRRSPSLEYRRPAELQSEYSNYAAAYGDYLRAAQMQSNYQRRL
ncbi:hypothetical protein NDU88_003800 [Pleurodeles waltl]|uniref:RNA-binding protein 14 n=1 Tax=Pleurodeles waltl TaxID=8319 RepID=A0AAV7MVC0_PLEWA|nr:hypothetical protein NDU88_003800 [Pleurodeles waltl]